MHNTIPMTQEGAEALRRELHDLKKNKRPAVIQAIAEARAHGDLRENAEYHAAKEQQGFIEGRIKEIENRLSHAQVIDVTKIPNNGRVIFGATVTLLKEESEEEILYKIVGDDEADIQQCKIAISAPLARALIGKTVDDEVDVKTPAGIDSYCIIKVEYL